MQIMKIQFRIRNITIVHTKAFHNPLLCFRTIIIIASQWGVNALYKPCKMYDYLKNGKKFPENEVLQK